MDKPLDQKTAETIRLLREKPKPEPESKEAESPKPEEAKPPSNEVH